MCSLLLGKNFFAANFAENKVFFVLLKQTIAERDKSQFLVRKQSIEMSQSPMHLSSFMSAVSSSLKIYEFSHHNNFMVHFMW
jgi:hypothetical protein